MLGVASDSFDDLPDNRLHSVPRLEMIRRVESLATEHQPATVLTHHAGDLNIDHRRVHQAVITACRPRQDDTMCIVFFVEVSSSSEWQPVGSGEPFLLNWFVDIGATLQRKLEAPAAYADELCDWRHPRSSQGVQHLAPWHGATVGCEAAEALVQARHIR